MNKTISLPEALITKLKQEDNASKLIEQLLELHYAGLYDPESVKAERQKLKAQTKFMVETAQEFSDNVDKYTSKLDRLIRLAEYGGAV